MILNFTTTNKAKLFDIMTKYDYKYPNLGTAISKTIQGTNNDSDIEVIDCFITSDVLDTDDKVDLDKLFILRQVEF